jgi:hypothetical protein
MKVRKMGLGHGEHVLRSNKKNWLRTMPMDGYTEQTQYRELNGEV